MISYYSQIEMVDQLEDEEENEFENDEMVENEEDEEMRLLLSNHHDQNQINDKKIKRPLSPISYFISFHNNNDDHQNQSSSFLINNNDEIDEI